MSCWVVPTIAAEFLGIPLTQVMERARKGTIPHKTELGFMLVDVAPHSPKITGGIRPPTARPTTYVELPSVEVTKEEQQALIGDDELATAATEPPLSPQELAKLNLPAHPEPVVVMEVAGGELEEDEPEEGTLDWRPARLHASRLRRAPRGVVELAA